MCIFSVYFKLLCFNLFYNYLLNRPVFYFIYNSAAGINIPFFIKTPLWLFNKWCLFYWWSVIC